MADRIPVRDSLWTEAQYNQIRAEQDNLTILAVKGIERKKQSLDLQIVPDEQKFYKPISKKAGNSAF